MSEFNLYLWLAWRSAKGWQVASNPGIQDEKYECAKWGWDAATQAAAEREAQAVNEALALEHESTQTLLAISKRYLEAQTKQARAEGAAEQLEADRAWLRNAPTVVPATQQACQWAANRLGKGA